MEPMKQVLIFPQSGAFCNEVDLELEIPIDIKSGAEQEDYPVCHSQWDHQVFCKVDQRNNKVRRSRIFYIINVVLLPKNYLPLLHTITQTCSNTANPPCFDIAIKQNCSKARQKWRCGFQIPYFQAPARHLHKSSSTKCSPSQGDCLNSNIYAFAFGNASCAQCISAQINILNCTF